MPTTLQEHARRSVIRVRIAWADIPPAELLFQVSMSVSPCTVHIGAIHYVSKTVLSTAETVGLGTGLGRILPSGRWLDDLSSFRVITPKEEGIQEDMLLPPGGMKARSLQQD